MVIVRMSSQVILIFTEEAAFVELNVCDVVVCLPLALQGENQPPLTSAPTLVWPKLYSEVDLLLSTEMSAEPPGV